MRARSICAGCPGDGWMKRHCANRVFCYADARCKENVMVARIVFVIACLLALAPAANAQSGDPSGVWLTQAGDARVRVSKCGGGLCGVVVWLREPLNSAGKPQVDDKNPNPA